MVTGGSHSNSSSLKVEDAMIPRSEVYAVDIDDELSVITEELTTSKHTRIPIYYQDINKLLGFLSFNHNGSKQMCLFQMLKRWEP